jgi:hypothetical protein
MNFFQNYRKIIIGIINKNNSAYSIIFIVISCILFLIFAVGLVQNPFGPQRQIFYLGTDGFFGDFLFGVYMYHDRDPYSSEHAMQSIYFPLSYIILNFFSKLDDYADMTYGQVTNSRMALMSAFLFTGFSVFFLFMSLNRIQKKFHIPSYISIGLILSYPFFFAIERGNFIVLSAASVGFFICYYDSKKANERVFGAICLALAIVLKITPVFFGFLYFEKKQYREIFLSAIIAILLAFLPFLYFKNGFANIPHFINTLRGIQQSQPNFDWYWIIESSPLLSLSRTVQVISILFGLARETIIFLCNISNMATYLMFFFSIVFSFLTKDKYLKISLLSMAVTFFPGVSVLYVGLYLFPMIIIFFSSIEKRSKLLNVFALIVFLVYLNPYQIAVIYYLNITFLFINIALILFWAVLLVYSGMQIVTNFRNRQVVQA